MKHFMFCAAVLLVCALPARAADVREKFYTIGADVDTNGHVIATQVDADVSAPLAATLAAAVKQWQFVPAKRDGQPVPAHTFAYVKLQAIPDARGQYGLRISFEGNGPRLHNLQSPPHFPRKGANARESAFLMIDATAQPDGRLTDMMVSSRFEAWPVRGYFKSAVLDAAKRWYVQPEQVDGKPVATQLRIPVNFVLGGADFTTEQIRILREAAGKEAAEDDPSGIPLPSERNVALDSPLQPSAVATIISAP